MADLKEIDATRAERNSSWKWIPSLYFAEGIPYVLVMSMSVIMYKKAGNFECRYSAVYELAVFTVGHKADMEPLG